ncbi:MAG: helix-turn-helix domain-containing protein [Paracoccaceae bacterium]
MVAECNRALDRGILVLETLSLANGLGLAALHRNTGIPKSSLRRALQTLMSRRLVRRSIEDGKYRSNILMPIPTSTPAHPAMSKITDVAMPYLLELTKTVQWPSDLHLISDTHSTIIDSTRFASPFNFHPAPVDRKLNLFGSAAGIVCLAAMDAKEVAIYHNRTLGDNNWGLARFGLDLESYREKLEETRNMRYGARLSNILGEPGRDDNLLAIAVPIILDEKPVGAITLLWSRQFSTTTDFAAKHLRDLRTTAKRISSALS